MQRDSAVVLQAGGNCLQHLDVFVQAVLSSAGLCLGAVPPHSCLCKARPEDKAVP